MSKPIRNKICAILLAGGKGERFGSKIPKPYMSLNGKPVIQYSIDVLDRFCDVIIIVVNENDLDYVSKVIDKNDNPKLICVVGGASRSESAEIGTGLCDDAKYIIIHDAVRPFITDLQVSEILKYLHKGYASVDTAVEIVDGFITEKDIPCDKKNKLIGQTPEGFAAKTLRKCFKLREDKKYQDEVTMLYKMLNIKPQIVAGTNINTKMTYPVDLGYADGIMKFFKRPIDAKKYYKHGKTLVFGGTGDIGMCCASKVSDRIIVTRKMVELDGTEYIDLTQFDLFAVKNIIFASGAYNSTFETTWNVNYISPTKIVKMLEDKKWKGSIVFLSSTAATFGRRGIPEYSASKSALNAWIEARAEELSEKGIYINAIAPAKVAGRLQKKINKDANQRTMIKPMDVANYVIRYLDTETYGDIIYLREGLY